MRKILPVILIVVGLAGGAGSGYFLRPAPEEKATTSHASEAGTEPAEDLGEAAADDHGTAEVATEPPEDGEHAADAPEYVKLNNQFVVPVVEDGFVTAMVILSLSLEVSPGSVEAVYAREPKLRDVFLQVLFDHANAGGFRGSFTDGANLILLRKALLEIAQKTMGDTVADVLIVDIARQDT